MTDLGNYDPGENETGCNSVTIDQNEKLKCILLSLACELKRICEKHNLVYFMHAGTLLGAVRHKGFIPWDDDMDFALPRKDFERLIEVSRTEIAPPFFLQTYENTPSMVTFGRIRLRMDRTTGVQLSREINQFYHQGLAIDIAPLDCIGEKKELAWKRQDWYACIHYRKHYGNRWKWFKRMEWHKRLLCSIMSGFLSDRYIVNRLRAASLTDGYLSEFQNERCCIISSECMGAYRHRVMKQEWFQSKVIMKFEDEIFPAPVGYLQILALYYGSDYMSYPPEEYRKGYHFPVMSTGISYSDYLKPFWNIFEGTKNKTIVVFGAGEMVRYYLKHTKRKYHPAFIVDNDSRKWGKIWSGIPVKAPERLLEISPEKLHLIICSIHYKEIAKQLDDMGVKEYYIFVQNTDWL